MRTHCLVFSLLLILFVSISFSNDYSFTITGELPVSKLNPPSNLFQGKSVLIFQPEKRALMWTNAPAKVVLTVNPPDKQSEIVFLPIKSMSLITVFEPPPEKLEEERTFFDPDEWILVHKPLTFTLNEQKTGGIAVNLIHRKAMRIPEIAYNSKVRT